LTFFKGELVVYLTERLEIAAFMGAESFNSVTKDPDDFSPVLWNA